MKRKTKVKAASPIRSSCSVSAGSTPSDSRDSPSPCAIAGRTSRIRRSSRPLRSSSPKSRASRTQSASQPCFLQRLRREQAEAVAAVLWSGRGCRSRGTDRRPRPTRVGAGTGDNVRQLPTRPSRRRGARNRRAGQAFQQLSVRRSVGQRPLGSVEGCTNAMGRLLSPRQ